VKNCNVSMPGLRTQSRYVTEQAETIALRPFACS